MITNELIALETVVKQQEGMVATDMDGEKVMLSIENGKYYNLGEVGGVIWEKLQSPVAVIFLIESLIAEYDVEFDVCKDQVLSFLEHLLGEQLIQIIPSAG